MSEKYHIETTPAHPEHKRVGKFGIIDWYEDCSSCHTCVKDECIYLLYSEEDIRLKEIDDFVDYLYDCKGCLQCIQNCTKGLLSRVVNPEFERLGNDYWTPDLILTTWYQAETGRIPVSGAGYNGPFTGEGFDSMWTDMSEIVRPTRDGIHGREYISTVIDIGGKGEYLEFNGNGELTSNEMNTISLPAPIILQYSPYHDYYSNVFEIITNSAQETDLLAIIPIEEITDNLKNYLPIIIPQLDSEDIDSYNDILKSVKVVEFLYFNDDLLKGVLKINPDIIPIVKLPFSDGSIDIIKKLITKDIFAFHLNADWCGNEIEVKNPLFIKDLIINLHQQLVREGIRDKITLIGSGGIALAEHLAKAIICGLDVAAVDIPLFVALECRLCEKCVKGVSCPITIDDTELEYGIKRMVNLIASWHNQLLEVMGAMGIREARRLRGETGRAIFYEKLCERVFNPIFGDR